MEKKGINRRSFVGGALAASATMLNYKSVLGANDRIGIGMIGCGDRTQGSLLKDILEFQNDTNVEVVAICDTWNQKREEATQQVKAAGGKEPKEFVRYQDLLASSEVDAVVIATPEHQHCTQLIDAVKAGKDAYVEKPLGMTMAEVNEAYDAVKESDKIVQNGTQIRSLPQSRAAQKFIAAGGLGRILKAAQSRNGTKPFWYRYADRQVSKSDVDWDAFLMMREKRPFDPKLYAGWYGFREFSLGPHTTQGLHFVDTVHYVTGVGCPKYAMAHFAQVEWKDGFTVPDSVEMVLEYPEGWVLRYGQFFGNSGGRYLNVYGTRGTLDGSNWSWTGEWKLIGRDADGADRIAEGANLPPVEGTPHMKNWLECLRSRQQPLAPMEAGYSQAVAGIMADLSNQLGRRMMYDPDKREVREA
jgi:predicted dehydrogenase